MPFKVIGQGDRPQEFRGCLRAVTNVGISLGALLAGWIVQVGTLTAYQLLIIGNALAFAASAAILVLLPPVEPGPTVGGPRWIALRDRPYLVLTVLDGIMAIQFKVLTVAIPLWIVEATTAPPWLISGTMLLNTVLVIALQVRAGRNVNSPVAGAGAYRRSGMAFLLSCALVSLSAGIPAWAAGALLLTAVLIHTIGELWHSAAGFEVSFGLAPKHATGQYLGVFGLGAGLAEALGPALLISACITWGRPGWYVVGALFAVTGLAAPLAVRWAQRQTSPVIPPRARGRSDDDRASAADQAASDAQAQGPREHDGSGDRGRSRRSVTLRLRCIGDVLHKTLLPGQAGQRLVRGRGRGRVPQQQGHPARDEGKDSASHHQPGAPRVP
ncbi:MFS transporter [Streptomyces chattanoogensis]|uniref:MFS transporter n=1 Tax=Streptomyces chattanoogensis TaxID=66876 RepID=UPI000A749956|nr:MFS transporter [Streptomyces chattanoogensis]